MKMMKKNSTDSDAEESASENSQVDVTENSDGEVESDNEEAYDSDSESTTVIQKEVQTPCHHCKSSNVCELRL